MPSKHRTVVPWPVVDATDRPARPRETCRSSALPGGDGSRRAVGPAARPGEPPSGLAGLPRALAVPTGVSACEKRAMLWAVAGLHPAPGLVQFTVQTPEQLERLDGGSQIPH